MVQFVFGKLSVIVTVMVNATDVGWDSRVNAKSADSAILARSDPARMPPGFNLPGAKARDETGGFVGKD
jgi:hypothetical protein